MKITKKLMMAAGLFFQLSNLQAMTDAMQQAIDLFGGKDAVIATGNLPDNKKMNPGEAKKIAFNQGKGTPEAQAVAYYVSSNVGGATVQKGMFPDKDKADTTVTAALELDRKAAPAPAQEEKADEKKSATQDCSALEAQLADVQAQLAAAQAESDKKPSQSQILAAQQATTAANSAKATAEKDAAFHEKDARDAKTQLAALQAKMAAGDPDLAALVAAAKNENGADKYVPLATKAAESLKAAVDAIENQDVRASVMDAIKAVFAPQAADKKASKQSQNMGRLGKKKKNKA